MDRDVRRLIAFPCESEMLVGTLDSGRGATGLLIVSGGNEIRCGAHRGMAQLAADVAARGHPVFRYDRRGIGDSTGENAGFLSAGPDLVAAAAAFRTQVPELGAILGFGNCDAASTLALHGRAAGIDRLLLANPWTVEDRDDLPPAAAIRATYRTRLTSPAAWRRLLTGRIDIAKAVRGLRKAAAPSPQDFGRRIVSAIDDWGADANVVLATGDATAQAYAALAGRRALTRIETGSHSFARAGDHRALADAVLAALSGSEASDTH